MRAVVGMSGGVDSSVVAYLLKEAGWDVVGLFMKNWEDEACPAAADFGDVAAVCGQLDIPYYAVNFAKEYWERVFARCLEGFRRGVTPNPDVLCNREIKFALMYEKARELGGDFLATGHYCRRIEREGRVLLGRGVDQGKDQSYFLYTMQEAILEQVLFPLGEMEKGEVREIARKAGLATAEKKDSTGICFVGKRNFRSFLSEFIESQTGNFEKLDGTVIGQHDGVPFYTIGQRKGLKIGGPGEAWFVVGKDPARNVVFVEQGEHESLFHDTLFAEELSWVGAAPSLPLRCSAQVRYRSPDAPCTLHPDGRVLFDTPQKALTPGQAIVFYDGTVCLGGGIIADKCLSCWQSLPPEQ